MYNNILVGSDPEFFLKDYEDNLISSIGLIGGTKEFPHLIDEEGSAIQEDNVAVEFNTIPAKTKEEFVANVSKVLSHLVNLVKEKGLVFSDKCSEFFPEKELKHPKAKSFGCEPDYNVWTTPIRENNFPTLSGEYSRLRTCGGHIHIGFDNPNDDLRINLIKAMDVFVGCPSILFDNDNVRRMLYGKAGSFRFKHYGVEYRTLSNFWIKSKDRVEWVFDQTIKAIHFLNNGGTIQEKDGPVIQEIINRNEYDKLQYIIDKYGTAN